MVIYTIPIDPFWLIHTFMPFGFFLPCVLSPLHLDGKLINIVLLSDLSRDNFRRLEAHLAQSDLLVIVLFALDQITQTLEYVPSHVLQSIVLTVLRGHFSQLVFKGADIELP